MNEQYRLLWGDHDEKILKEYILNGHTIFSIAERFNKDVFGILLHLRALFGFEYPDYRKRIPEVYYDEWCKKQKVHHEIKSKDRWPDDKQKKALNLFNEGYNIFLISELMGITPGTLISHFKQYIFTKDEYVKAFNQTILCLKTDIEYRKKRPHYFGLDIRDEVNQIDYIIEDLEFYLEHFEMSRSIDVNLGVMNLWDEDDVKDYFKSYGEMKSKIKHFSDLCDDFLKSTDNEYRLYFKIILLKTWRAVLLHKRRK